MISEDTVALLRTLPRRDDAQRHRSIVPLGGIYWDDELPDVKVLHAAPDHVRNEVFRLFSIRFKLWDQQSLPAVDEAFWADARTKLPQYGLFKRLVLSEEDRAAQEATAAQTFEFFEAMASESDHFSITDNGSGVSQWSATMNVSSRPNRKTPWWQRFWRRT